MKDNMIKKYNNNILEAAYNGSGGRVLKLQEENSWNYTNCYYVKEELAAAFPLEELMKHKSNTLADDDKVYFTKSSSIPRYKLKEFLDISKVTLNRTNRIEQATAYVVNINAFKEFIYSKTDKDPWNNYYIIPVDDIAPHAARGFKTAATSKNLTEVLLREGDVSNVPNLNVSNYPKINILKCDSGWGTGVLTKVIDSFVYLANKQDVKIIFDETLVEMCNSGVVIDEEIYENLASMLKSDNKENISLAMEIISNSDLLQSKAYILLLLNEFKSYFKTVNKTTNYQTLLNYFSSYGDLISSSWEYFTDTMIRKHCENDNEKLIMKKYMLRCLNQHMKNYNCKLNIKDIAYE